MVDSNNIKIFALKYLLISKKITLVWAVQKIDFLGPHFGGVPGEWPPKNSGDKIAIAAQRLHKNYILMFCGLGEE